MYPVRASTFRIEDFSLAGSERPKRYAPVPTASSPRRRDAATGEALTMEKTPLPRSRLPFPPRRIFPSSGRGCRFRAVPV